MSILEYLDENIKEYHQYIYNGESDKVGHLERIFRELPQKVIIPMIRDRIEGRSKIIMLLCETEAEEGHLDDHAFEERRKMYALNDRDFEAIALIKGILSQPSATSEIYEDQQGLKEINPTLGNVSIVRYLQRTMSEGYINAWYTIEHVLYIRPDSEMHTQLFCDCVKTIAVALDSANKESRIIDLSPLFKD